MEAIQTIEAIKIKIVIYQKEDIKKGECMTQLSRMLHLLVLIQEVI